MEILDVIDEYGNPTGKTVTRSDAHSLGIPHRTSHVWILRKRNGRVQVLLQKRCAEKDSFPGCLDISSAGHIPAGSDFKESAVRELREELGVETSEDKLIFAGDRKIKRDDVFFGKEYHDRQYSRVFVLWDGRDEDEFTIQKEELESVMWMDFEETLSAVKNNAVKHCIYYEELDMLRALFE